MKVHYLMMSRTFDLCQSKSQIFAYQALLRNKKIPERSRLAVSILSSRIASTRSCAFRHRAIAYGRSIATNSFFAYAIRHCKL